MAATMEEQNEAPQDPVEDEDPHPAREMTLHLLRMLETRADAAGIALQTEIQSFQNKLQLKLIFGAAVFFAVWSGIVLLAIVLPPHLRVPVLSTVVALFSVAAVVAYLAGKKQVGANGVGSMAWFLDSLRLDFEVLSRSIAHTRAQARAEGERSEPDDLAA